MNFFEEYLHSTDPEVVKRAENWRIAIGLQDVDGLSVSDFLIDTVHGPLLMLKRCKFTTFSLMIHHHLAKNRVSLRIFNCHTWMKYDILFFP